MDNSLLDATGTSKSWGIRMWILDCDVLHQYREARENRALSFRLKAIYEESAETEAEMQLTDCQRETLNTARDFGYFEIPQRASLEDVADQCGISLQAASEQLC